MATKLIAYTCGLLALAFQALSGDVPGVYVMLSLTTVNDEGYVSDHEQIARDLDKLVEAGVDGYMVDVWWGITEKESQVYDFSAYQELVAMAKTRHLKVQLVASFHECGGNVGDACNIPLPAWLRENNADIWFKDQHGNEDKEYISFFADNVKLHDGRTPLQMYGDWMTALANTFAEDFGSTIVEIQVGAGPCGELRYPSYVQRFGWRFPGIGVFQVYDKYASAALTMAILSAEGARNWELPPVDAGDYNSRPDQTGSFTDGYLSPTGSFFLNWYFDSLKTHAAGVLDKAQTAFGGHNVTLAAKVAGIHWWYGDHSHAAEVTAGYYNTNGRNAYREIAEVFKSYGATLDFTCLEMRNSEQPSNAHSYPEYLVQQVLDAAHSVGVKVSGENALARYDEYAYEQILSYKSRLHAFTYLRLSTTLLTSGFPKFQEFVSQMHAKDQPPRLI